MTRRAIAAFWIGLAATLVLLLLTSSGAQARTSSVYLSHRQAEKLVLKLNYRLDYVTCIGYGRELHEGDGRFRHFDCAAGKRACVYTFNLYSTTHGLTYRAFEAVCDAS